MPCQSATGRGTGARRVRLTDQALVAATIARRLPPETRHATVADLLAGLVSEPDGRAGRLLRERMTAAARLPGRAAAGPPGVASLDTALARGSDEASPRTAGTADLLLAALEVGGQDLADLATGAGYDPAGLYRAACAFPAQAWSPGAETVGLGSEPGLDGGSALAVARVRAAGGGAVDLVLAIAALPEGGTLLDASAEELAALADAGAGPASPAPLPEHGLEAVLEAARAWCAPPITAGELLRAAVIAGGPRPAALLAAAGSHPVDPRP